MSIFDEPAVRRAMEDIEGERNEAAAEDEPSQRWEDSLATNRHSEIKGHLRNALFALRNAPGWQGVLRFNEFKLTIEAKNPTPWGHVGPWTDFHDAKACEWFQKKRIDVSVNTAAKAVDTIAHENKFHPVREFLEECLAEWDRQPRLDRVLIDYFAAVEDDRTRTFVEAIGARWMISAVARIFEPGIQADQMLILESPQGRRKSTGLRALFEPWFSDDLDDIGSKDSKLGVAGVWCIELGEMDPAARSAIERVKAFITRRVDRFRAPYDRRIEEHPRQCVLAGTTNDHSYLKDSTGGRRFWPFKCTGWIDPVPILRDKKQLWGEAVFRYRARERFWFEPGIDDALLETAEKEQHDRLETDPWHELVMRGIAGKDETSVAEILTDVIGKDRDNWTQGDQNRVARILRSEKWERVRVRENGALSWKYRPPT